MNKNISLTSATWIGALVFGILSVLFFPLNRQASAMNFTVNSQVSGSHAPQVTDGDSISYTVICWTMFIYLWNMYGGMW